MGPPPAPTLEAWWLSRWAQPDSVSALLRGMAAAVDSLRASPLGHIAELWPRMAEAPPSALQAAPDPWGEGKPVPPDDPRVAGLAPELLFGCRREAMDGSHHLWAVGVALLSLLRLAEQGPHTPPPLGVDTPSLRPLRITLITDVHRRKPSSFAGRRLPPHEFLYPDGLPDADRAATERALSALQSAGVAVDPPAVIDLLDGLLKVAPGARVPRLDDLPGALRRVATACEAAGSGTGAAPRLSPGPQAPPQLPSTSGADSGPILERLRLLEVEIGAWAVHGGPPRAAAPAPTADALVAIEALRRELGGLTQELADLRRQTARQPAAVARPWLPLAACAGVLLLQLGVVAGSTGEVHTQGLGSPPAIPPTLVQPSAPGLTPAPAPSVAPGPRASGEGAPEPGPASTRNAATPQPAPRGTASVAAVEGTDASTQRRASPGDGADPSGAAGATPGRLRVRGGNATLMGEGGPVDPGAVPPGSYQLQASTSDGRVHDLGRVTVGPGTVISVACGFGRCAVE